MPVTYDFSNAGLKAFGANQVQLENGLWALYSGDTNLDVNVDNSDHGLWEGDANSFANGDYSTAPNGNGNVDNGDYGIWSDNANEFIYAIIPGL